MPINTVELLSRFGLTQYEARLYVALHGREAATGYELAKAAGLARANAYAALSGLTDKGAAALAEGRPAKYTAVPVREFCAGVLAGLEKDGEALARVMGKPREDDSGYVTLRGADAVEARIRAVIAGTEKRIYLSFPAAWLERFRADLAALAKRGKKVVVVTGSEKAIPGVIMYLSRQHAGGFRLISDSAIAMTGELEPADQCSCLYARKKNLAGLLKESIRNEITLIEMRGQGMNASAHTAS